jgi:hypothetical protein
VWLIAAILALAQSLRLKTKAGFGSPKPTGIY